MTIVLQDAKSGVVLEVLEEENGFLKGLTLGEYLPLPGKEDLYQLRAILPSHSPTTTLLKVKTNKKSDAYTPSTVFSEENEDRYSYLSELEDLIENILTEKRKRTHVHSIVKKGIPKVAKKFGEESVELVIESGRNNEKDFRNEAADVLYYFLILIHERGYFLRDVLKQLKKQKRKN